MSTTVQQHDKNKSYNNRIIEKLGKDNFLVNLVTGQLIKSL